MEKIFIFCNLLKNKKFLYSRFIAQTQIFQEFVLILMVITYSLGK